MKVIRIPIAELAHDKYHRFSLSVPATQEVLRAHGVALDDRGQPRHPYQTWYDAVEMIQVFEQGERA